MIAEVSVINGEVKVERVVIGCDCGVIVNPRGVETQLEGGMIYGLSAALFGEITLKNGQSFKHVDRINRGAGERALTGDEIAAKFIENAELVTTPARARELRDIVLDIENTDARRLAQSLKRL